MLSYKDGDASISDVLADQSVVVGLGNVDRSETLWAVGLSPFAPIAELSYEDCAVLTEAAARIVMVNPPCTMSQNVWYVVGAVVKSERSMRV